MLWWAVRKSLSSSHSDGPSRGFTRISSRYAWRFALVARHARLYLRPVLSLMGHSSRLTGTKTDFVFLPPAFIPWRDISLLTSFGERILPAHLPPSRKTLVSEVLFRGFIEP